MFNLIDLQAGWKIDLIIRKSRPFSREEFRRRRQISDQRLVFVAAAEDVIIAKLEWAPLSESERQMADVTRILKIQEPAPDRSYLHKWIGEMGLEDLWASARRLAGVYAYFIRKEVAETPIVRSRNRFLVFLWILFLARSFSRIRNVNPLRII